MEDRLFKIMVALVTALSLGSLLICAQTSYALSNRQEYICTTQKGTWVNVRSAPYTDAEIVGTLRYGYSIYGVQEGAWIRFMKDGKEVYVRGRYFETPHRCRCIVTKKVNKRTSPGGEVLGQLKKGTWIDIFAITMDDDGIEWGRGYGNVYIQMQYLKEVVK